MALPLTQQEFEDFVAISKEKAERIINSTNKLYRDECIKYKLTESEIKFLEDSWKDNFNIIQANLEAIRLRKEYELGWNERDPYFLYGAKAMLPFIYRTLYLNQVKVSKMIVYSPHILNQKFGLKEIGELCDSFHNEYVEFLVNMKEKNTELFMKYIMHMKKKDKDNLEELALYVSQEEDVEVIRQEFKENLLKPFKSMPLGVYRDVLRRMYKFSVRIYGKKLAEIKPYQDE